MIGSTVLLVDDDPVDLAALRLLLESWELAVLPVRSGAEAIERLATMPVDVLVSDVRMPRMNGEEVVAAVARSAPGLPVVLITGKGDVKSAVRAMKLGAFDYITKPPDPDEFRLTIERALEHSGLRRENAFLRAQLGARGAYGERLIGRSPAMLELLDLVDRVAQTDSTVLVTGETGTGKELVAQTLHYRSRRADKPFVALNCAAVHANLIESELFGHAKGAFTGAVAARRGRFEDADRGTLFLDEISETSPAFQAKLLRVLQEGEFERVGGDAKVRVDVRILASTNRDLEREVAEGRFREDLFYRLRVIPVHIPPLRERREDIPSLVQHFLATYAERYASPARAVSGEALEYLVRLDWKGNVRELQHAVERAVVLARGEILAPDDFEFPGPAKSAAAGAALQPYLEQQTREHLLRVLDGTGWRKGKAAGLLGIDRATLYRLLKKHNLTKDEDR